MCDIFLQRLNQYGDTEAINEELRLLRTILERLECSFAKQEAKLDRKEAKPDRKKAKLDTLLNYMMTSQTPVPQTPQCTAQTAALRNAHHYKFICIISRISTAPSSAEAARRRQLICTCLMFQPKGVLCQN